MVSHKHFRSTKIYLPDGLSYIYLSFYGARNVLFWCFLAPKGALLSRITTATSEGKRRQAMHFSSPWFPASQRTAASEKGIARARCSRVGKPSTREKAIGFERERAVVKTALYGCDNNTVLRRPCFYEYGGIKHRYNSERDDTMGFPQ